MAEPHVPGDGDSPDSNDEENAVETTIPGRGPTREGMVSDWLPGEDNIDAKTILDINDPVQIAKMRNYKDIMPKMEHMQDMLNSYTTDFMTARTSVAGKSREEHVKVLSNMYGGSDSKEEKGASMIAEAFGAAADEED